MTNLLGIPFALGLAIWEGQPFDWRSLITAASSNIFILIYAGICVQVYRHIEAYKVSSAEYSGLIGAVVVGIIWFNEVPNMTLLVGSALIILPLIWLATLESMRFRQKVG